TTAQAGLSGTTGTGLSRSGGTVNLYGVLTNTGDTLVLDSDTAGTLMHGSWNLLGGTIVGGTGDSTAGTGRALCGTSSSGSLNGVTLTGQMTIPDQARVVVTSAGLTLASATVSLSGDSRLDFTAASSSLTGTGAVKLDDFRTSNNAALREIASGG